MQITPVDLTRMSIKQYKKLFFHFVDISLYNAHKIQQVNSSEKISFYEFRQEVARGLLKEFATPRTSLRGGRPSNVNPIRLIERRFPEPLPQTNCQGRNTQRACHVCISKKFEK
jgi:hypothetical protein